MTCTTPRRCVWHTVLCCSNLVLLPLARLRYFDYLLKLHACTHTRAHAIYRSHPFWLLVVFIITSHTRAHTHHTHASCAPATCSALSCTLRRALSSPLAACDLSMAFTLHLPMQSATQLYELVNTATKMRSPMTAQNIKTLLKVRPTHTGTRTHTHTYTRTIARPHKHTIALSHAPITFVLCVWVYLSACLQPAASHLFALSPT